MRLFTACLLLSISITANAFAQTKPEAPKAVPVNPVVIQEMPADSEDAGQSKVAPSKAVPESETKTPVDNSEMNLKVNKGSGGRSTSSLITGAPLMTDFVMGKAEADVIMIEYVSMTCPHCAHFSNTVLPDIEKKYIDTGKIRYILRQFPLNEPAIKAASLLECVGAQNKEKYYVFAKVLFDAQNKWAFDGNYMAGLETIANVGGLSKSQFQNCVNDTDREMAVLKVRKLATDELKIPHTPYIFIGGEVYDGDRSVEAISQFIDAKLAEAAKAPPKKAPPTAEKHPK